MAKKQIVNNLTVYEQGSGECAAIFLHGYGANGRDLFSFGQLVGEGRHRYFPEGPIILDQFYIDAHAWFAIDLDTLAFDHAQYRASAEALVKAIELLGIDPAKSVIAGFSQGAMMALEVALLATKPFQAVGLFSTTPIDMTRARFSAGKTRFFQSHGRHDSLLPFAAAEELYTGLVSSGWSGTFHQFAGEHEIPEDVVLEFKDFVNALNH